MSSARIRPYAKQAKGKTIKSFALDCDVAARTKAAAKKAGVSASAYVNDVLKSTTAKP